MIGLNCNNLCKKYNGKAVVDNVNLEVATGKIIGLLGPNGAGKTTTFFMIVGLIKCDGGNIQIDDNDITDLPMHIRSMQGISYLPQEASIFRNLSAEENILAILETRKDLTNGQKLEKFDYLIDILNIKNILKTIGASLSGGERRRVEIARALATDPKFLLLDEPFAGIDPISVIEIQKIIKSLASSNIGILITDHNVRETLSITYRAYLLYEGNILISGKADDLSRDEKARKLYLGSKFRMD